MEAPSTNVLLLGLGELSRQRLETVFAKQGRGVHSRDFLSAGQCMGLIDQLSAGVIFCEAEPDQYRPLLDAVRHRPSPISVVVVGRPEVSAWLDALEAGAADYCAPPFEDSHLYWIVQSALKSRALLQASAAA